MLRKEAERPNITPVLLKKAEDYDRYLQKRGIEPHDGARAKGILYIDGSMEAVIDTGFYLGGGISPDQLQAIVLHELVELTTEAENPDFESTLSEYGLILTLDDPTGLEQYHANMNNLLGGTNADTRKEVFRRFIQY